MKYTRIHRLLKIVTLIEGRGGAVRRAGAWNAARLAEECEVAERTIFRDINELQGAGIPIRFNPETREYSVVGDFFLPPVQLTADEALALAVLCEEVAGREQVAFLRPAWRALAKIEAAMPRSVRDEIAELAATTTVRTAASAPGDGDTEVYERVQRAIATRRALLCRYESPGTASDEAEDFDFEPYALFFSVRAWYAVGYHAGRDGLRTLKLTRFTKVRPTERPFEIPAEFSIDEHVGNAWRMMRGEPEHRVEVHFDAAFAETMSDTLWHKTQEIEHHADGSATFRCTVAGLDEIVWWVLSMGPHCRVIGPECLADQVAALARQTADRYAG